MTDDGYVILTINGTRRLVHPKNSYGIYHLALDEADLKWLREKLGGEFDE